MHSHARATGRREANKFFFLLSPCSVTLRENTFEFRERCLTWVRKMRRGDGSHATLVRNITRRTESRYPGCMTREKPFFFFIRKIRQRAKFSKNQLGPFFSGDARENEPGDSLIKVDVFSQVSASNKPGRSGHPNPPRRNLLSVLTPDLIYVDFSATTCCRTKHSRARKSRLFQGPARARAKNFGGLSQASRA